MGCEFAFILCMITSYLRDGINEKSPDGGTSKDCTKSRCMTLKFKPMEKGKLICFKSFRHWRSKKIVHLSKPFCFFCKKCKK